MVQLELHEINSGKSDILFLGNDNISANIDNQIIISENNNELLGKTEHISKNCFLHVS